MRLGLAWCHHGNLIEDVAIAVQILTKEWRTREVSSLAVNASAAYHGGAVCCAAGWIDVATCFTCSNGATAICLYVLIAWIDRQRQLFTESEFRRTTDASGV